jgi:hypothetical protein
MLWQLSLHVQGVSQNEGDLFLLAAVGEPIPGEHALAGDGHVLAEGGEGVADSLGEAATLPRKAMAPAASRMQTARVLACRSMPQ